MSDYKYEVSAVPERTGGAMRKRPTGNVTLLGRDSTGYIQEFCTIDVEGALHLIRELSRAVQHAVKTVE